jgi:TRAP-type mannitol/chloroaromatic compound transport system permease small subunit
LSSRRRLSDRIDRFTGFWGTLVSWLTLLMVLIGAYNAVVRYLGRFLGFQLSSNVYLELQWYLFSLIFLLGAGWALRENAHVRVDVAYARWRPRTRRRVDLLGTVALLMPFCMFVLWVSLPSVQASWSIREGSPDPGGLPRYPIKTVILIGIALLMIQGFAELLKLLRADDEAAPDGEKADTADARASTPSPTAPEHAPSHGGGDGDPEGPA